jgi:hypothetical protein
LVPSALSHGFVLEPEIRDLYQKAFIGFRKTARKRSGESLGEMKQKGRCGEEISPWAE